MQFEYVAVFALVGLVRPNERIEGFAIELESEGLYGKITGSLDSIPLLPDQATAVGSQMLRSIFDQPVEGKPEERLTRDVQELRADRAKKYENCAFLLVQAAGEVSDFSTGPQSEIGDFVVTFCDSPKSKIRSQYEPGIQGLLAALAIASTHLCGIKKIVDQVTFRLPDSRPLFCVNFTGSGRGVVSTSLPEDSLDVLPRNARTLARHQALVDCARLLTRSLVEEGDPLLSFLSVWSGLEIFVNKNFKEYETRLLQRLSAGDQPSIPPRVVERIRTVMSDKYRLSDKFSLIAAELADPEVEGDQKSFEEIKATRDRLLHGEDVDLKALPLDPAQRLLRKYLRLHLSRDGA